MFLRAVAHCCMENANQKTESTFLKQGGAGVVVFHCKAALDDFKGFMHRKCDFVYKSQSQNGYEDGALSSKCLILYRERS